MQTKLTLRIDNEYIDAAKAYAQSHNISLSKLTENFYKSLAVEQDRTVAKAPILQRLTGILPEDISVEDLQQQHLEDKYG